MTREEKAASRSIFHKDLHLGCWKKWLIARCRKHLSPSISRCHWGQDDFLNGEQSSFERPRRKFRPRLHPALIPHRLRIHTIRSWFIFVPTVKPFEESYTKERGRRNVTPLMLRRIRACRVYKKKKGEFGEHVTPVRRSVQWHAWLDFAFHRLTIDRGGDFDRRGYIAYNVERILCHRQYHCRRQPFNSTIIRRDERNELGGHLSLGLASGLRVRSFRECSSSFSYDYLDLHDYPTSFRRNI